MNKQFPALILLLCLYLVSCVPTTYPSGETAPLATTTPTKRVAPTQAIINTAAPASPPLPGYILSIKPPPDSIIPNNLYQSEMYNGQICLEIEALPLVELGHHLTMEDLMERSDFHVNGLQPELLRASSTSAGFFIEDEMGTRTYYGGPYTFCYPMPLQPGLHEATFQVRQISGNVLTYTWYFKIVE